VNKNKIYHKIEHAISEGIFPGAVLLCAVDREVMIHDAFGMADIFEKRKMGKDYIFDLASLTKPLATALAVSALLDRGKIALEQTIGSLLEAFNNSDKAGITIEMLLRHTSGYPAYREYYKQIIKKENPRQHLRHLLADESLENRPGEIQVYSDPGFMILSWIIEKIICQRIDTFVSQNIYSPLEIDDLFFINLNSKNAILQSYQGKVVATQQCPWREKILVGEVDDDNAWAAGGVEGHAGLFGNAGSIYILCNEILNALQDKPTKILSHETIMKLVRKKNNYEMVAGFDTPSKENSSSGSYFSGSSIGHLGFTGTSFWIDPEISLIIIFLTNSVHPFRFNRSIKNFRGKIHDLIYREIL